MRLLGESKGSRSRIGRVLHLEFLASFRSRLVHVRQIFGRSCVCGRWARLLLNVHRRHYWCDCVRRRRDVHAAWSCSGSHRGARRLLSLFNWHRRPGGRIPEKCLRDTQWHHTRFVTRGRKSDACDAFNNPMSTLEMVVPTIRSRVQACSIHNTPMPEVELRGGSLVKYSRLRSRNDPAGFCLKYCNEVQCTEYRLVVVLFDIIKLPK